MAVNQTSVQEKANAIFMVYLMMGPSRTLERLYEVCTDYGLKTSLSALKQYSVKYNWQERLQTASDIVSVKTADNHAAIIMEMNDRQSRLGQAMQAVSSIGLQQARNNPARLSPRDAVHLGDIGSKLERLAKGEATTRQEITNQMISPIVYNIVTMFQQINMIDDREERQRQFAIECDEILEQAVGPIED
jgi:hypothetical protein